MATCEGCPVNFIDICENSFFFQVESETEVDGDAFGMCPPNNESYWLRSMDHKFLLLNEKEFQAEDLNSSQQSQPESKFKIQTYDEIPKRGMGKAAILYVKLNDSDNMVVCCDDKLNICAKKMVLPNRIDDITNEAVFYMIRKPSSNTVWFQSSVDQSKYLGFASVENLCVKKLILRPADHLDGTCDILREKV